MEKKKDCLAGIDRKWDEVDEDFYTIFKKFYETQIQKLKEIEKISKNSRVSRKIEELSKELEKIQLTLENKKVMDVA